MTVEKSNPTSSLEANIQLANKISTKLLNEERLSLLNILLNQLKTNEINIDEFKYRLNNHIIFFRESKILLNSQKSNFIAIICSKLEKILPKEMLQKEKTMLNLLRVLWGSLQNQKEESKVNNYHWNNLIHYLRTGEILPKQKSIQKFMSNEEFENEMIDLASLTIGINEELIFMFRNRERLEIIVKLQEKLLLITNLILNFTNNEENSNRIKVEIFSQQISDQIENIKTEYQPFFENKNSEDSKMKTIKNNLEKLYSYSNIGTPML